TRRVVHGAAEGGFIASFFQELNGEKRNGHIFGGDGNKALGVSSRFGSISKLEAGFDESTEDLRAFGGLRIFQKKTFKVANEGRAVVAGGFDSLLEFVRGGKRFGGD